MEISIVHDSAASLPFGIRTAQRSDLVEVPFTITVEDGDTFREWIDRPFESDVQRAEFVNDLRTTKIGTAQPNPEAYKTAFEKIIRSGVTEIAVVPMSAVLSGSIESARIAAQEMQDRANIVVADCKTVSIGQGLLITQADIENQMGRYNNANELAGRVEELSKQLYIAQAFPDLEYLRRGGRIGRTASLVAGVLGIKPIIGVDDEGFLAPIDKQKGWQRTHEAMVNYVAKSVGDRAVRLALIHFESDQLDTLRDNIADKFVIATNKNGEEFPILDCEQSMAISVHSGPGVVGFGALVVDK